MIIPVNPCRTRVWLPSARALAGVGATIGGLVAGLGEKPPQHQAYVRETNTPNNNASSILRTLWNNKKPVDHHFIYQFTSGPVSHQGEQSFAFLKFAGLSPVLRSPPCRPWRCLDVVQNMPFSRNVALRRHLACDRDSCRSHFTHHARDRDCRRSHFLPSPTPAS